MRALSVPGSIGNRHFLPYQRNWINDNASVAIGEKSRRIGWTYASAYRAVYRRLQFGTDLFHTSADLTAAREFAECCARWARALDDCARLAHDQVMDELGGITAQVLRFRGGQRIIVGSSNPKFFRSKGGDVDADEFAFHPQPRELYKAMQPAAIVWGHQLRLWSTHNGEGSWFAKLVKQARKSAECKVLSAELGNGGDAPIRVPSQPSSLSTQHSQLSTALHRVTLLDAVDQGLAEVIRGLQGVHPHVRQDFIAELRASCADEESWNEEYLCRPASLQSALLSYALIETCGEAGFRISDCGTRIEGNEDAHCDVGGRIAHIQSTFRNPRSEILYAGFDVGRKHDRSVLWVLERIGDVFWTRRVSVLEGVTFTAQEELLDALLKNRCVKKLCIDSTGIGAMLAERLAHRWHHRAEAIHFSQPVKAELAMPLVRLFQDRLIRIPNDPVTREDLHKVRRHVTASHNVRLDAARDVDGHADRFWALALAYHASDAARGRSIVPATIARKPVGW